MCFMIIHRNSQFLKLATDMLYDKNNGWFHNLQLFHSDPLLWWFLMSYVLVLNFVLLAPKAPVIAGWRLYRALSESQDERGTNATNAVARR